MSFGRNCDTPGFLDDSSSSVSLIEATSLNYNDEMFRVGGVVNNGSNGAPATKSGNDGNNNNQPGLVEQLAVCRSALTSRDKSLRRLRSEQEEQLSSLCRQMMSFECGLRRKQRELAAAIRQRDRVIREQADIIR